MTAGNGTAVDLTQVDLRHLRALCMIARVGHFGLAANELGYTQSAISQQIAALERQVGQPLVERPGGRRPVWLTESGQLLCVHAEAILARLEHAATELSEHAAGSTGNLRVGSYSSVSARLVPQLISRVTQALPGINILLDEDDDAVALQRRVAYGELDLAFAFLPIDESSLDAVELFADPHVVVVRADDPLATTIDLTLDDLRGRTLAAFADCPHQRRVEAHLSATGVLPGVTLRSNSTNGLLALVRAGAATALLSELIAVDLPPGVVALPAGHLLPPRRIGLVRSRHRTVPPAAAHLVNVALQLRPEDLRSAGQE